MKPAMWCGALVSLLALTWSCGDSFSGSNNDPPATAGGGGEEPAPAGGGSDDGSGGSGAAAPATGGSSQGGEPSATCTPFERRLTYTDGSSSSPAIVYNGTGYGVVWQDDVDGAYAVYFGLVDAQGRVVGEPSRISEAPGVGVTPVVVWNGSDYGVAWQDERDGFEQSEIYFRRVSALGTPVGEELRVTTAEGVSYWPSLVWNGTGYALVYSDTRENDGDVYLQLIDAEGAKVGEEVRVTTSAGGTFTPAIIADGNGYALAFNDNTLDENFDMFFARLGPDGAKLAPEIRLGTTPAMSQLPRLVAMEGGYSVFWEDMDGTAGEVQARALDSLGKATGVLENISTSFPGQGGGDLAWSETTGTLGAIWADATDATAVDIFFARFDTNLERLGEIEQLTAAPNDSRWPRLVELNGDGWATVFEDMRDNGDSNEEIYFAKICP